MKTRLEIIEQALKLIGVMAEDEAPTAYQIKAAGDTLDGIFAELQVDPLAPFSPVSGVPDAAFTALARFLAAEISPAFAATAPMSRPSAYIRIAALIRPDDRVEEDTPEDYA
jgi:hypothetical protein